MQTGVPGRFWRPWRPPLGMQRYLPEGERSRWQERRCRFVNQYGSRFRQLALVRGPFALHRPDATSDLWTLSHRPTGSSITGLLTLLDRNLDLVARLEALGSVDWKIKDGAALRAAAWELVKPAFEQWVADHDIAGCWQVETC